MRREQSPGRRPSFLNNESGQGITEYILVLIVVVAIILGGLYQVNTAFRVWAENYFGEYLSCLLETGELPTLGGSVASGICNELYEPFSIDKGRPLLAGAGTSGGSGSSSSSSSSQSSNSSSPASTDQRATRDSTGGRSGSSQINPSARFGTSRGFGQSKDTASSRRGSSSSNYTGSTESSVPMSLLGSDGYGRFKVTTGGLDMSYLDNEDRERKQIKAGEGTKKAEEVAQERSRKKVPLRAPAAKTEVKDDEGMTFGSFLRYIIIAAIIIALVLVVGGQLLQASKSSGGD